MAAIPRQNVCLSEAVAGVAGTEGQYRESEAKRGAHFDTLHATATKASAGPTEQRKSKK